MTDIVEENTFSLLIDRPIYDTQTAMVQKDVDEILNSKFGASYVTVDHNGYGSLLFEGYDSDDGEIHLEFIRKEIEEDPCIIEYLELENSMTFYCENIEDMVADAKEDRKEILELFDSYLSLVVACGYNVSEELIECNATLVDIFGDDGELTDEEESVLLIPSMVAKIIA